MSNEYKEENKANEKSLNMMDLDENLRKMIAQTIEQSVKLAVEDTVAVFSERINELENKLEQANERLSKQEVAEKVVESSEEEELGDAETLIREEIESELSDEHVLEIEGATAGEAEATSNEKLGDDAIAALFAQMNAGVYTESEITLTVETESEVETEEVTAPKFEAEISEDSVVESKEAKPASGEKLGDDAIAALFAQMNAGAESETEAEATAEADIQPEDSVLETEESIIEEITVGEPVAEESKVISNEKLGDDAIVALFAQMSGDSAESEVDTNIKTQDESQQIVEGDTEDEEQAEESKSSGEKLGQDAIAALFAQMNGDGETEAEPESETEEVAASEFEAEIVEDSVTESEETETASGEKLGDDAIAALFAQMNASADTEPEIMPETEAELESETEEVAASEFEAEIVEDSVTESEETETASGEKLGDDAIAALFAQMNCNVESETESDDAELTVSVYKTEPDTELVTEAEFAEEIASDKPTVQAEQSASGEKLGDDAIAALFAQMNAGTDTENETETETKSEAEEETADAEQIIEEVASEELVVEEAVDEAPIAEPAKPTSNEKLGDDAIATLFAQMNGGTDIEKETESELESETESENAEVQLEFESESEEIEDAITITEEPITDEPTIEESVIETPITEESSVEASIAEASESVIETPTTEALTVVESTEAESELVVAPAAETEANSNTETEINLAELTDIHDLEAEMPELAGYLDSENQASLSVSDLEAMLEQIEADEEAQRRAEEEEERIRRELERLAEETEEEKETEPAELSLAAKLGWEDDDEDEFILEEIEPILTKREKQALKQAAKDAKRAKKTAIKNEIKKQKKEEKKAIKDEKNKKKSAKQRVRKQKILAKKAERKARGLEREPKSGGSVTILLATYNPTKSWLKAQLRSLNEQTYENIRITILDDCSEAVSVEDIERIVQTTVINFPYNIHRNETHLGREKTYEALTELGTGDYFAYCSQDDVWEPGKIKRCLVEIEEKEADMAFTDAAIINQKGEMLADSITKVRKQYRYMTGAGVAHHILAENFISGSTMLIKAEKAKAAMPFCPHMKYDQYLAYNCAKDGKIAIVGRPMVHRRFEVSQLQQTSEEIAKDTKSYIELRIDRALTALKWLETEENLTDENRVHLEDCILWFMMRKEILKKRPHMLKAIWISREFGLRTVAFEYFASRFSKDKCSKMLAWFERTNHMMPKPKPQKEKKKKK